MDAKNRVLLSELSQNARISIKALAKKLKLSESSTVYRLEKLNKQNILLNTHVIINPYKLGRIGYRINFSLKGAGNEIENSLTNWINSQRTVHVFAKELYHKRYVIMSWPESTLMFHKFLEELKLTYGKNIFKLKVYPYIAGLYFARKYIAGIDRKEIEAKMGASCDFDNLDISILQILANDARISSLRIARKLGKDVQTIISRIKNLQKNSVIIGYGCNINISKLGYEYYKLNIVFTEKVPWSKLLEFARKCPNTVYLDKTLSMYDFEFNVEVESKEKLKEIISDLEILGSGFEVLEIKQIEKYEKLVFI